MRLLAHELTHVVQEAKSINSPRAKVARAVDTSKAEPIKKELDSILYVSTSTLEELWAGLGVDLPEAINNGSPVTNSLGKSGRPESYRDLWWRSINEGISLSSAGKPLIGAFATDTVTVAKDFLSSQLSAAEKIFRKS